MEKKRPQLETKKSQKGKLISKGKHTVKEGNHPHTKYDIKTATMRRVQMQEMGTAFEIKTPAP